MTLIQHPLTTHDMALLIEAVGLVGSEELLNIARATVDAANDDEPYDAATDPDDIDSHEEPVLGHGNVAMPTPPYAAVVVTTAFRGTGLGEPSFLPWGMLPIGRNVTVLTDPDRLGNVNVLTGAGDVVIVSVLCLEPVA